MSTVVNRVCENGHAKPAHLMPICRTSTFGFDTVEEAGDVFAGKMTALSGSL
jgi:O-acetylhomoserine/O-acetylserine sulfhydrylase-like pyridoxal-dependent enzyme